MKEKTSIINNMTEGPLFRQLVLFSLPILAGNILQACYTLIDMVIAGNFVGSDGLSAIGIGGVLHHMLLMAAMGLGFGGQILLSQQVGAKASEGIRKTIGTFMTLSLVFAVLTGIIGVILTEWLLHILNTPQAVYQQTRSYYLIGCGGIVFIYGYNCVCAILRGLGESKLPTVFVAIASVLNIALDIAFIVGLGMNIEGAALATVISQGVSFLVSLVYLTNHREAFGFDFRLNSFRPDWQTIRVIMKLAFPMIIYGFLMSISSMFVNSNVNVYGVAASAVDGIGNKLTMVSGALIMGLYTGAGAIVGQCFGSGNTERIRKTFFLTIGLSLIIWVLLALMLNLFPVAVFRIFTEDPEVLGLAKEYLFIATFMYLGMSLSTGPFALFEGVGNTTLEMVAGIIENMVLKIAFGIFFSRMFGLYGYWIGCAAAVFVTPIIGYIYFSSNRWTKRKVDFALE